MLPDLSPQKDATKFFDFSRNAGNGPSRAGGSSKTFPEVPIEICVLCGKQESRLIIPRGLGILKGSLGTGDIPELLALSGS